MGPLEILGPMSQANVDLVLRLYDGWARGEPGLELMDEDISMVEPEELPGRVEAHGIDSVSRYIERFSNHWDEIRFDPEEVVDAGDRVVVIARLVGRWKASGVAVERLWAYVWTFRDGRALRMEGFADRAQAIAAAGL